MNSTLFLILFGFLMVVYAMSFIYYMKQRSNRKNNQNRILQLPLFMAFLIGPLLFFMINNNQRREKRKFMKGNKRRFS
ncbi:MULTISPECIES: hypothetical protein [Roseivirga]|uniref:hypothetical protein n=1 Tax=Roseivirga TaxID=290180 RepID=UPI0016771F22|nr:MULTISPECIES: hypothetical protein [Roseivirga]MEC7755923.1 hypothetical protein [Bacteroidota bacterium]